MMDFVRLSVLPTALDESAISDTLVNSAAQTPKTLVEGVECPVIFASCIDKCLQILPLLVEEKDFASKYWTLPIGIPDCYVYSHRSSRCIVLEVVTCFPKSQTKNNQTYNFTTHPFFEDIINKYTKCKEKPNPNLIRSRCWDLAVNVVMKVEALPSPYNQFSYLLNREHRVMNHLWQGFMDSNINIDEMTGIPMVFEYVEIPNDTFVLVAEGQHFKQVDMHGKIKPLSFGTGVSRRSTLAYMTMEKLGPSLAYLQILMRASNKPPFTFDLWTALKIFDQILCRIMQVHRFRVVHNDIAPENVYMGRGEGLNVVYLNSFKRSYVVESDDKEGPIGLAASCVGSNIRFSSAAQLSGSAQPMHPVDDVECAFYVLLAMLSANNLPWDALLRASQSSAPSSDESNVGLTTEGGKKRVAYDEQTVPTDAKKMSTGTIRMVYEMKQRFWSTNNMLNSVTTNAACIFMSDEFQSSSVCSLIREIYFRIRSWKLNIKGSAEAYQHCKGISTATSEEYRNFNELRKSGLIFFQFSETFEILNDLNFRKKVTDLTQDGLRQQPWNVLTWCFNSIELKSDTRRARQRPSVADSATLMSTSISSFDGF